MKSLRCCATNCALEFFNACSQRVSFSSQRVILSSQRVTFSSRRVAFGSRRVQRLTQ
jgi:hypothetical protein